jgi:hypothetical protein
MGMLLSYAYFTVFRNKIAEFSNGCDSGWRNYVTFHQIEEIFKTLNAITFRAKFVPENQMILIDNRQSRNIQLQIFSNFAASSYGIGISFFRTFVDYPN